MVVTSSKRLIWGIIIKDKSFKSLFQNIIGRNAPQYTVNKHTYIHALYINTKTYQQINVLHYKYNYMSTIQLHVYTKRKPDGHTNQNKACFSNFKGFHNEHNFIFCFHKFNTFWHIQYCPIIRFNICFFLIHGTKDFQVKHEIHLPNHLHRFYMFFH